MATIQTQRSNGQWMDVDTCDDHPSIVSNRLKSAAQKYRGQRVKAVDSRGSIIDMI
jgi:hypothetical protein